MNKAEKIYEEVLSLPEFQAQEVSLGFRWVFEKKYDIQSKDKTKDMSEFDQFGAMFDGKFNRDECYDRKVFR
jgi:hypothetical protein